MSPGAPPLPDNEVARLAALRRYGILDSPGDEDFDFLTEMAALVCEAPYAFVIMVDEGRSWIKSAVGEPSGGQLPRSQDYCAWTILEPESLQVPDLLLDPRMASLPLTLKGYRMYSGVNLHAGDGLHIGTLCVLDNRPRALTPAQMRLLKRLSRQVMALIELRAAQRELQAQVALLAGLARHDDLTGLLNRRELAEALDRERAQVLRYGGHLSVLLLDVDHFKQINDQFGHPRGDEVLRRVSQTLAGSFRQVDIVGRYGGEEFLVVLPQTTAEGAQTSAAALLGRVAGLRFDDLRQQVVTLSGGIATLSAGESTSSEALIDAADKALYQAKAQGRNRVLLAPKAPAASTGPDAEKSPDQTP